MLTVVALKNLKLRAGNLQPSRNEHSCQATSPLLGVTNHHAHSAYTFPQDNNSLCSIIDNIFPALSLFRQMRAMDRRRTSCRVKLVKLVDDGLLKVG